jgi:DNA-binding transcriptional LysR family regulator
MLPSWDDLRLVEAMVRKGSARAVGLELGLATSTVYRRIGVLEQALGLRCLLRGRGVTENAHALAAMARTLESQLSNLVNRAKTEKLAPTGTLTLTTIDGFLPLLSVPMAELSRTYPELRINVHISNTGLSLRRGHADLGLAILERPHPSLVGRKVFPVHWSVYGQRGSAFSRTLRNGRTSSCRRIALPPQPRRASF